LASEQPAGSRRYSLGPTSRIIESMLRDPALIPLSRQHQHALALCVRIERALQNEVDLDAWQLEVEQHYEQEIGFHFAAEENVLFPVARRFAGLVSLVEELSAEHRRLRECCARAKERTLDQAELGAFATLLSGHIRKEERQLFEAMQTVVEADELQRIGAALEGELALAAQTCKLPQKAL
jgi:hemerythrin-like domain-containing protein